jgi:glycosyltransferase involved in cell wall biosynthesis
MKPMPPSDPALPFAGVMHVFTASRYGGIESHLATMARHPRFAGQSYALVSRGRLFDELEAAGADVIQIGPYRTRYAWQAFALRRRLRAALAARHVHTVVTHMSIPHALAAPVVGDRTLVYFAHEDHKGRHWSERWARLSRHPDVILADSEFVAGNVRKVFARVKPAVVYCPVELVTTRRPAERDAVRHELATPPDHRVILTTSRFSPYKGHPVLIDALGRLRHRAGWTAWIAGGPQTAEEQRFAAQIRARATALKLDDRVRWLGERSDVGRLLQGADIHCQANVEPEPFGIAFIEALSAGLPVVTSAFGGAVEIVTPELGQLVPPGDPEALADALARCLDDPEKAHAAHAFGPARAQALCAPEAFADRFRQALTDARTGKRQCCG